MDRLLRIAKPVALVELLWAASVIYGASDGSPGTGELIIYIAGAIFFGLVTAALAAACLVTRRLPRAFAIQTLVLLGVFAAVSGGLAFRARFAASRQSFEEVARAIVADENGRGPRWIGLFRVQAIDTARRADGVVRFVLGDCGVDHCGVAYSPRAQPPRVGEDLYAPLGGPWWRWHKSW